MTMTHINPRLNRSDWGPGPWDGEPDKVSWTDETTGMPCLIVRNRMGSLCGYVAVEPGHPAHGQDYDAVDVDVHGGLTFAESCNEDGAIEGSVCHVPEPGKPGDVWWLGFDCAHAFDVCPSMRAWGLDAGTTDPGAPRTTYKTVSYVRNECERLASQLAGMTAL